MPFQISEKISNILDSYNRGRQSKKLQQTPVHLTVSQIKILNEYNSVFHYFARDHIFPKKKKQTWHTFSGQGLLLVHRSAVPPHIPKYLDPIPRVR